MKQGTGKTLTASIKKAIYVRWTAVSFIFHLLCWKIFTEQSDHMSPQLAVPVAARVREAGLLSQLRNSRHKTLSVIRIIAKFWLYVLSPTSIPTNTHRG